MDTDESDIAVVGAGAAGLFAALRARGALLAGGEPGEPSPSSPRVALLDGSPRIGRKILVSGGGRCNVTNVAVDERDYATHAPRVVRAVLREFPVEATRQYFRRRGVDLVEEPIGKLFPTTQRAADVLGALLADVRRAGIPLLQGAPVTAVERLEGGDSRFELRRADGARHRCRTLIVATGGKSVPRTGSTGFGYELARRLGETLIPPRPALVPIFLAPDRPGSELAGITCAAILSVCEAGVGPEQLSGARYHPRARAGGSLLFSHRGLTGPCALDVSEALASSSPEDAEGMRPEAPARQLVADFWTLTAADSGFPDLREVGKAPGSSMGPEHCPRPTDRARFEQQLQQELRAGDRSVQQLLGERQPRRLVQALLEAAGLDGRRRLSEVRGREMDRLWRAVVHASLEVRGTDGFAKAEVTAGGVDLRSLQRRNLESRRIPGLRWCGEVLDATGRLGGFNFQWAWASGYVAGGGLDT